MKKAIRLTNKQRTALGYVRLDCGEPKYQSEKVYHNRNNDNVRSDSV